MQLFTGPELRQELENRRGRASKEVVTRGADYLLNVPTADFVAYLVENYGMAVPTLRPQDAETVASATVERGSYGERMLSATTRIPFDGGREIFHFEPNLYGPAHPEADIVAGFLVVRHVFSAAQPPDFDAEVGRFVASVTRYLTTAAAEASEHNKRLASEMTGLVTTEKEGEIAARDALANLTIPVEAREDAPRTYAAPGIERRAAPEPPAPTRLGPPRPIEPMLVDEFFEHIVAVIGSTGQAMERTPGTFAEGSETQKRDVLLVMLNSHYKGAAAGEVFNGSGKADIVLRLEDQNVLVAECKFWAGIKSFRDALEQLEGYLTLRDTHAALIFFVKGKDVAGPVAEAADYIAGLGGARRLEADVSDTDFRYRLRSTAHEDREIALHVLFFHVRADA